MGGGPLPFAFRVNSRQHGQAAVSYIRLKNLGVSSVVALASVKQSDTVATRSQPAAAPPAQRSRVIAAAAQPLADAVLVESSHDTLSQDEAAVGYAAVPHQPWAWKVCAAPTPKPWEDRLIAIACCLYS